jgi:hypothetical protein
VHPPARREGMPVDRTDRSRLDVALPASEALRGSGVRRVVVIAEPVTRSRPAVSDEASNARERGGEIARVAGKRMVGCISRAVQLPDFSRGLGRRQGMKHGQDRSRADPGTEQHYRSFAKLQGEASSWRADFEDISTPDLLCRKLLPLPFTSCLTLTR